MIILICYYSPLAITGLAVLLVAYAKLAGLRKPSLESLIRSGIFYAAIGALASLALTIVWMVWYEASTGYSAGNGPLAWIFIYGPVSATLGMIAALARWWFKKDALPTS
jgi:hypothetical protein